MENRPEDKREAGEVSLSRGEKLRAGEIREQSKFLRWLDNYWYHYKWPTIFVALALICVIVIIVQLSERKEYDYRFVYAGPVLLSESETAEMADALAKLGTGGKRSEAALTAYFMKHSSDITAEDAYYAQMMQSNRTAFQQQILAGKALIFLMDPKLFSEHEGNSAGFLPVRDYFPEIPPSALAAGSDCGLRLDATVLWDTECFRVLPPDTVVCLRTPVSISGVLDRKQALAYHDRYEAVFSKLYRE